MLRFLKNVFAKRGEKLPVIPENSASFGAPKYRDIILSKQGPLVVIKILLLD
jgi:hypothetical protein